MPEVQKKIRNIQRKYTVSASNKKDNENFCSYGALMPFIVIFYQVDSFGVGLAWLSKHAQAVHSNFVHLSG